MHPLPDGRLPSKQVCAPPGHLVGHLQESCSHSAGTHRVLSQPGHLIVATAGPSTVTACTPASTSTLASTPVLVRTSASALSCGREATELSQPEQGSGRCRAPVELEQLCFVSLPSMIDMAGSARLEQALCLFYGRLGSSQAATSLKQLIPFCERLLPALFHRLPAGMERPSSQSQLKCQQMLLNCATILRIQSQAGHLAPRVRQINTMFAANKNSARKAQGALCDNKWTGKLYTWGQCRIGGVAYSGQNGLHLPVQRLNIIKGPTDVAKLPLYPSPNLTWRWHLTKGSAQFKPANSLVKPLVLQDGRRVAATHHSLFQTWTLDSRQNDGYSHSWVQFEKKISAAAELAAGVMLLGCEDGAVLSWKLDPHWGLRKETRAHDAQVTGLCVLDKNRILSGSKDGLIKMWREDDAFFMCVRSLHKGEQLHSLQQTAPDRFISRSTDDVVSVWQIKDDGFDCIALLDPGLPELPNDMMWDDQAIAHLRVYRARNPAIVRQRLHVLSNNMVIRAALDEPSPRLLYNMNNPHTAPAKSASWCSQSDAKPICVPVWVPTVLPEKLCSDCIVLLQALPDARIAIAFNTGSIVFYDPCFDSMLELYAFARQCPRQEKVLQSLNSGAITEDGFLWLCDDKGTAFTIDPFVIPL